MKWLSFRSTLYTEILELIHNYVSCRERISILSEDMRSRRKLILFHSYSLKIPLKNFIVNVGGLFRISWLFFLMLLQTSLIFFDIIFDLLLHVHVSDRHRFAAENSTKCGRETVGVRRYVNRGKFEWRLVNLLPPYPYFLWAVLITFREAVFCSYNCLREIHTSIRQSSSIDGSCLLSRNYFFCLNSYSLVAQA